MLNYPSSVASHEGRKDHWICVVDGFSGGRAGILSPEENGTVLSIEICREQINIIYIYTYMI